jgi:hypothetical protein
LLLLAVKAASPQTCPSAPASALKRVGRGNNLSFNHMGKELAVFSPRSFSYLTEWKSITMNVGYNNKLNLTKPAATNILTTYFKTESKWNALRSARRTVHRMIHSN